MTQMMEQYLEIKSGYEDFILMYRLGDFYEMFFEDAKKASKALDLTLTGRDCGEAERAPMCGVPFHSCDPYIKKLVEKGYKVAICEQMEDPAQAKGIVKREVIRVITPGTLTNGEMLDGDKNNYLAAVNFDETSAAIAFCDISSSEIYATYFRDLSVSELNSKLINEIAAFAPTELLCPETPLNNSPVIEYTRNSLKCLVNNCEIDLFDTVDADTVLNLNPICEKALKPADFPLLNKCVAYLIAYLKHTSKKECIDIKELHLYSENSFLSIDASSRRSLEISEKMRVREKKGSLLWVLDKTKSAVGARQLKNWIEKPLLNVNNIIKRQNAVSDFVENSIMRDKLRDIVSKTQDLERLISKIVYSNPNAKDIKAVEMTLRCMAEISDALEPDKSEILREIKEKCSSAKMTEIAQIVYFISKAIKDEPPFSVREGGMIKEGYNNDVDELNKIIKDGGAYIAAIENAEKELTGIKNLKISYNKVFGYYIEVSKGQTSMVPDRYIRKQTLVNGERYITQELKDMEAKILGAKDRITAIEYQLFCDVVAFVASKADLIRECSGIIADLDVFASLAECACQNNYVCPEVDNSDVIDLVDSRHPVVELTTDTFFVPNDAHFDCKSNRLALITGPNMAGKSTYMRQVALIVIMTQAGSFVPAKSARIGVVDKIFTRVGASDDLASGQSTFMLEMTEVAYILNNATKKSLILYDEIGRGTSTFDGMSIAKAVLEYTASKIGAKTLFATHYHELASLEGVVDGVKNYNVAAKKKKDTVVFLRKILPGSVDDSYGIEVANIAGVVPEVIRKAKQNLAMLEKNRIDIGAKAIEIPDEEFHNISFEDVAENELAERLKKIDVNALTPYECMSELYELVKIAKNT